MPKSLPSALCRNADAGTHIGTCFSHRTQLRPCLSKYTPPYSLSHEVKSAENRHAPLIIYLDPYIYSANIPNIVQT